MLPSLAAAAVAACVQFSGSPAVSVIIDDLGYRDSADQATLELPAPLAVSILPFSPNGKTIAARATYDQLPNSLDAFSVEMAQAGLPFEPALGQKGSAKRRPCFGNWKSRLIVKFRIVKVIIPTADLGEQFNSLTIRANKIAIKMRVIGVCDREFHIEIGNEEVFVDFDL